MNIKQLLNDPFLLERVNPLLVQEIAKYALQAKHLEQGDKIEPALTSFLFRKLLQPLYLNYYPEQTGTVFFLSTISSDGIGDYIALNKSAEILKESCPGFTIKLGYTHLRELPEWPNPTTYYAFKDPEYLIEKIVEGSTLPDFEAELKNIQELLIKNGQDYEAVKNKSAIAAEAIAEYHQDLLAKKECLQREHELQEQGEKFYQELLDSRAIVNISLALNTFGNPLLKDKSLYFSETGNFQGIGHAEQLNWYSMGLLPLEEGIFLRQPTAMHDDKHYISYITTVSEAKLCYIYLICQLQKSHDVRIVLFPLTDEELSLLDLAYLRSLGVTRVRMNDSEIKTGLEKGTTLYLQPELPVEYQAFNKFLQKCPNPVGCTGDLSLSEVLGFSKVPFYELRSHKIETVEALSSLARFLHLNTIEAYLTDLKDIQNPVQTASKLAAHLQSISFDREWQELSAFIHRYYCFENSLLATMKAFFAYQEIPNWKQEEQRILLESRSAKEVYSKIQEKTAS